MGDTAEAPWGTLLADDTSSVDLGVLLNVLNLKGVSRCRSAGVSISYVRVVAEESKAGGIKLGGEALED